jgi:hypothetical protein
MITGPKRGSARREGLVDLRSSTGAQHLRPCPPGVHLAMWQVSNVFAFAIPEYHVIGVVDVGQQGRHGRNFNRRSASGRDVEAAVSAAVT